MRSREHMPVCRFDMKAAPTVLYVVLVGPEPRNGSRCRGHPRQYPPRCSSRRGWSVCAGAVSSECNREPSSKKSTTRGARGTKRRFAPGTLVGHVSPPRGTLVPEPLSMERSRPSWHRASLQRRSRMRLRPSRPEHDRRRPPPLLELQHSRSSRGFVRARRAGEPPPLRQ